MDGAPRDTRRAERLQRIGALAVVVGAAALLGWRCARSPDVTWVAQRGDAAWITDPRPVDARVQQYGRSEAPVAVFTRSFDLESAPGRAELSLRAARGFRILVNGAEVARAPDSDPAWRRERVYEVAGALRAGPNRVDIEVRNLRGPPLLRARLAWPGGALATDARWSVAVDGREPAPAVLPDDTRPHPSAVAGPRPARALAERGARLAGIALVAALVWAAGAGWLARHEARLPALALAAVHAAWLALFVASFAGIPLSTGFDATNHLRYVELLREKRAVPLPTDGWSTFHPPLYYALVAGFDAAAAAVAPGLRDVAIKSVSFAAGLGQVWVAGALAGALAPGRPAIAALAILFAGCLPLNLYTASYVSNEPLHGFAFGLATWLGARALARARLRLADVAWLGVALGVAAATKATAVVAAAVAAACLGARAVVVERVKAARLAALGLALALPPLAIAGWWYARNWRLYGSPIVGNWDLPGMPWWSQPGFHTAAYYFGFGESLRRPVFAGFRSFGDALYSSFWGDGWIAGRAIASMPPEHQDWAWAALGYWLALPATAVLLVGCAVGLRNALGPPGRRAAWSFVLLVAFALGYALLALTLEIPYAGQAKAPYALGLVPILAVLFAVGAAAVDRALARAAGMAGALAGRVLLTTAGAVFLLSFAG